MEDASRGLGRQAGDCHGPAIAYSSAVDDVSSWRAMRESTASRLPGPDNLGWWAGIAFLVAVILHVAAFFALGHIKIALGFQEAEELSTGPINLEQVEVLPPDYAPAIPAEPEEAAPEAASLLEEIDLLAQMPEQEIDMTPLIDQAEFAISLKNPAVEGEPSAIQIDPTEGFDFDSAAPEIGRTDESLPLAAEGQVIVDPGSIVAGDDPLDKFTEEIIKKGAGGHAEIGSLDGVITLDDMIGLPADVLVGKKTMLPSDLLFEYNSDELRESARVGLMKLALLIEKNPNLYCWIEGHTDLHGGDEFNLDLSRRRAASVREYLTGVLRLDGRKIVTRGFGKGQPIVPQGSIDEQAPNRRVEIKMRREPPPAGEAIVVKPQVPPPAPPQANPVPEPEAPKAVLVRPMRALPVEEDELPELPAPKARPVEEEPPKALPVEEDPPRAREVEE